MQALPVDTRNLPLYSVSQEQFICTSIVLVFLSLWALVQSIIWCYRTHKHINNYQYIIQYNILREYEAASEAIKQIKPDQNDSMTSSQAGTIFGSDNSSRVTVYSPNLQRDQLEFNRNESRQLEFICLFVVCIMNINSFTCTILQAGLVGASIILFAAFNMGRCVDSWALRAIYLLPLLGAYVPFYIYTKAIIETVLP